MEDFHASFSCDVATLRELRQELTEWCNDREIDSGVVVLAAHEAAANAIKHACSTFDVAAHLEDATLLIEVSDAGRRLAEREDSGGQQVGLSLISVLMDHVEIRDRGTSATIRMMHSL